METSNYINNSYPKIQKGIINERIYSISKKQTFMISISLHLFEQYTGIIMFLTKVGRVKITYWLLLVITAEVETTCRISRNIYVTAL